MLVSHHQDLFRPFGPCVPRSDSDVTSHGPAADVTSLADDTAMAMMNQKNRWENRCTSGMERDKHIFSSWTSIFIWLYGDLGIQYGKKSKTLLFHHEQVVWWSTKNETPVWGSCQTKTISNSGSHQLGNFGPKKWAPWLCMGCMRYLSPGKAIG